MSVCTAIDIGIPPQLTLPTGLTNISWLLYVWGRKCCKLIKFLISKLKIYKNSKSNILILSILELL